ncbi:MAG: response regulator transcription factor [Dehalococcoidia bacterium]|uniref:response regulator transcription factor n=1 Tax=Candidatus Amarobacter glycogenicus TaxID=3140699 RepID=UPI003135FDBF|nr:response regulator transcription factor [Dehalococcoidia bacterium]
MSRILVVEDEPMVAEVVERYLRLDGHEVTIVFDGVAACDEFDRRMPDLIVLDPDVATDGWDSGVQEAARSEQDASHQRSPPAAMNATVYGAGPGADDYVTSRSARGADISVRGSAAADERTDRASGEAELRRPLQIDAVARSVEVDGRQVALTGTRARHPLSPSQPSAPGVVAREQLLSSLWED